MMMIVLSLHARQNAIFQAIITAFLASRLYKPLLFQYKGFMFIDVFQKSCILHHGF